jgi:hypothetical protein
MMGDEKQKEELKKLLKKHNFQIARWSQADQRAVLIEIVT